jgi:hypothetical protein
VATDFEPVWFAVSRAVAVNVIGPAAMQVGVKVADQFDPEPFMATLPFAVPPQVSVTPATPPSSVATTVTVTGSSQ